MRLSLLNLVITFFVLSLNAASVYVRDGASGSGADWSDALDDLPATLVRDNVYWMADGVYAGRSFTTANSGTTVITICKATSSSHGTDAGWVSSYGDGQAEFSYVKIDSASSDYWIFDGKVGNWKTGTPYGFKVGNDTVGGYRVWINTGGKYSTFQCIEAWGPGGAADYPHTSESQGITGWSGSDVVVSNCWVHGVSTALNPQSNWTVEHCVISDIKATTSPTDAHENLMFCAGVTNVTYRYNFATNYNNEGVFISGYIACPHHIYIYGNVFVNSGTRNSRGIELRTDYSYTNIYIFNNTVVGTAFLGINNAAVSTSLCYATNNLTVNATSYYVDMNAGNNADDSTTTRFVSYPSDLRLSASLPGVTLASEYSLDINGITRGSDGSWDIGAYEYYPTAPRLSYRWKKGQ